MYLFYRENKEFERKGGLPYLQCQLRLVGGGRDPIKTTAKKSGPLSFLYISSEGLLCVFVEDKKRLKEVSAVDPASWFLAPS
jgi:hypothetical protein